MKKGVVIAFGSFDVLHPGHIHYLMSASRHGSLVVVVARDRSIKMLKGKRPLFDEKARLEMVSALGFVHKAVLGARIRKWNDIYRVLLRYRPSVIALGYDQRVDMKYLEEFLRRNGLDSRIVRIGPYKERMFKSSKIKKAASRNLPVLK
ncbi:FAD synthase [Candidatus Marsarchaeota archaeon]|nr:FAD synthase [Candidatus Marsarchaeota archaeon]